MSEQRTVLVEEISYLGTDGKSHIGVKGEKITVAKEGIEVFDWIHGASPEAQWAERVKAEAKPAKAPAKQAEIPAPAPKG